MPGYGCLCGGCRNCLEAQGYDLDRIDALNEGMDEEVMAEWLADADKISDGTAGFSTEDWTAVEQAIASGNGGRLIGEYRRRLRTLWEDDAKTEAAERFKARRKENEQDAAEERAHRRGEI